MTTQTDNPILRVFRYGDKTFPDPGSEHTVEQILQHLRGFFPELGHAKTEEKRLDDGTLEITFSKQVTSSLSEKSYSPNKDNFGVNFGYD